MSLQQLTLFYAAVGWGSRRHSQVTEVLELRYCHVLKTCERGRSGQARKELHSTVQLSFIIIVNPEEMGGIAAI